MQKGSEFLDGFNSPKVVEIVECEDGLGIILPAFSIYKGTRNEKLLANRAFVKKGSTTGTIVTKEIIT